MLQHVFLGTLSWQNYGLATVFFGHALFFVLYRKRSAEEIHDYYARIYQPKGPWWRNGAFRPSLRVSSYLNYLLIGLCLAMGVFSLFG